MDNPKFITLSHVAKDITGQKFGNLVALGPIGKIDGNIQWLCLCDCGSQVVFKGSSLREGRSKHCGHLKAQRRIESLTTHGKSKGREYSIWTNMKQRCFNPNNSAFHHYGGRGITVCERWVDSFENFYADMGKAPESTSLDRIQVDGNYEPSNCRWADNKTQGRNRRNCHYITFNDETMTVTEWAERIGVKPQAISSRISRGWSVERALTPLSEPARFEHGGDSKTLTEWSKATGIERPTLYYRIVVYGWSVEKALTTPVSQP